MISRANESEPGTEDSGGVGKLGIGKGMIGSGSSLLNLTGEDGEEEDFAVGWPWRSL